jgi:transcriptional regulator with XRE-family HTH domain
MVSGDLLREARRRAGLSQAELARRTGKHRSAIGRWERGEALPSLELLRELIRACNLELGFRLARADVEEHDLALIRRSLAWTPSRRFEHGQRATRDITRLWREGKPKRGG